MDREELIQFMRENIQIELDMDRDYGSDYIVVSLRVDGEVITSSSIRIN